MLSCGLFGVLASYGLFCCLILGFCRFLVCSLFVICLWFSLVVWCWHFVCEFLRCYGYEVILGLNLWFGWFVFDVGLVLLVLDF